MRAKDGIAELDAVWECSNQFRDTIDRRDVVVDRINALVTEFDKLHEKLEDLDTELEERGLQCAVAVHQAATSQYSTVREGVAPIQEAMRESFPQYMEQVQQVEQPQQDAVPQEQADMDVPVQQPVTATRRATRPDGTVPRRPARPKRPTNVE